MDRVYVVFGTTGEYGDTCVWPVRALEQKADADALVQRLNAWCKEHHLDDGLDPTGAATVERRRWQTIQRPPEDPHFDCQYTGTSYSTEEVPFGSVSTG